MARRATRPAAKSAPAVPPRPKAIARPAKKPTPQVATLRKLDLDGLSAEQKVSILLREREKLLPLLEASQSKIAALEAREAQLADRIVWALDTLNDLLREPD